MTQKPLIFCALDTADLATATHWAKTIGPVTGGLKLGMEFVNAFGPTGIEAVSEAAPGAELFIDLKFHDIPNTVAGAVKALSARFAPAYLNVHAAGGIEMMRAAKDACSKDTKLLAVTLLTSLGQGDVKDMGFEGDTADYVLRLAALGTKAGLDGVVCSAHEIQKLRAQHDKDFVLMVPGIRPPGAQQADQRRTMAPAQALQLGATHLVIGRPITSAADPAKAAQDILDGIAA